MKINCEISNRSIWSTIGLILLGGFSYIQFVYYLIPGLLEINSLKVGTTTLQDIDLIWVPINTYMLISVMVCLTVQIFKPLKYYKEKGLIWGLTRGFIAGLIAGLITGIIATGIIATLELIKGSILGITAGLTLVFVFTLIEGLRLEFK